MHTFKSKWDGESLCSGVGNSKATASFCRGFKNMLTRELTPYGIEVVTFKQGYGDCSGFLKKDDKYIYIAYHYPMAMAKVDFSEVGVHGVLYRTARSERDYSGGTNNFSSIEKLPRNILEMFDNYDWYDKWDKR